MSQFIWFCIGAMFGIFLAGMIASGKLADERDAWNRFVSGLITNWTGTVEELRRAWDKEYLGR